MKYPYQNLSLKNLPGEIWKEIPGYEDSYELSNYGRIKSLERWVERGVKGDFHLKEKILKQQPSKRLNPYTKKYNWVLSVSLCQDACKNAFGAHRIVYYLFVKKFDLNDQTQVITFKDGNNLNTNYKNLSLVPKSAIQVKTYDQKRKRRPEKTISCYDEKGKLINTYKSITEASDHIGCKSNTISLAVNGAITHCKGMYWRFGKLKKIKSQGFPYKHVKRIAQYSSEGKLIQKFFSITEAEQITGYDDGGIRNTALKRRDSYKGFKWKYI